MTVPLDELDLAAAGATYEITERLHRRHEELYTYRMRDQDPLIVNARVSVTGELPSRPREPALMG